MKQAFHRASRAASIALSLGSLLLLAACGGGDPYAGLWLGTMSPQRQVSAIVLGDHSYYMLYSRPGKPGSIGGLVHGTGDFHGAKVTSTDAVDFNWEGPGPIVVAVTKPANLTASVGARQTLTGSVSTRGSFTGSYDRDFDQIDARLATIAGTHVGEAVFFLGPRPATFVVTATGQVSTTINACSITGQVTPRGDTNAFDLTIRFGGFPCALPGAEFTGIAYYREDLRQLQAAVVHGSRTQAIAFTGIKQ
jgi:hypothetical protein